MAEVIKTTFLLRRGYEAAWERNNPVLAAGEPGFVIDKNILKIGDGKTAWRDLLPVNNDEYDNVFNAETHYDFPSIGKENVIYKAASEKTLYQWNTVSLRYEALTSGESIADIEIIHGGNANGTT